MKDPLKALVTKPPQRMERYEPKLHVAISNDRTRQTKSFALPLPIDPLEADPDLFDRLVDILRAELRKDGVI